MIERDLKFLYTNLKYDIDNIAYIIGERVQDDGLRQRISDVTQDNNLDRVKRMLDLAYAEIGQFCYPYTKTFPSPMKGGVDVNNISDATEYVISLHMPFFVAESTFVSAKEHMNEYFIWRVMLDWLNLTAPDIANTYADKLQTLETAIRSDVKSRMTITHIKPSVF